jgi:hypothetical protein
MPAPSADTFSQPGPALLLRVFRVNQKFGRRAAPLRRMTAGQGRHPQSLSASGGHRILVCCMTNTLMLSYAYG